MKLDLRGAIDCDLHPAVPSVKTLMPYLEPYWAESITDRAIDGLETMTSYPPTAPKTGRKDWRPEKGLAGSSLELMQKDALDHFGLRYAICNTLYGSQVLHNEYMAAALCRAVNDWVAAEWLDKDSRLRASIQVPIQNPELAVDEINRRAADRRFVQVHVLAMADMPLGRRYYWPIFEACEKLGLPLGIHAGSMYRHATTSIGWPTYYIEDYLANSQAFEAQVLSLVAEGVFEKFPKLRVVLIESGYTWLPGFIWRFNKTWRGVRSEVPWVKRPPAEIIREHIRCTIQPTDAPPTARQLQKVIDYIDSDQMLLFSTDYPHWQFDGDEVLPDGLTAQQIEQIAVRNPMETYSRLAETVAA